MAALTGFPGDFCWQAESGDELQEWVDTALSEWEKGHFETVLFRFQQGLEIVPEIENILSAFNQSSLRTFVA